MNELPARKRTLIELEKDIVDGMLSGGQAFYYVGRDLHEIRDNQRYADEGFSGWEAYCEAGRVGLSKPQANRYIRSFKFINDCASDQNPIRFLKDWTPEAFAHITRLKPKDAGRVVKKLESASVKNGKPIKAPAVRDAVDRELDRPPRQPKPESSPPEDVADDDEDGNVHRFIAEHTGLTVRMHKELQDVPEEGWVLLRRNWKKEIRLLITASRRLADFLEEKCQ